jgi:dTMP kinase
MTKLSGAAFSKLPLEKNRCIGKLITVEGTDGSGKTTAIEFIVSRLSERGVPAVAKKMASPEARALPYFRAFAADYSSAAGSRTVDYSAISLALLGDRLHILRQEVLPLLNAGTWVVCDRYIFMTFAQFADVGQTIEDLMVLRNVAALFPAPDLGLVTQVQAEEALRRIRARENERNLAIDETLFAKFGANLLEVAKHNGLQTLPTSTVGETQSLLDSYVRRLIDRTG